MEKPQRISRILPQDQERQGGRFILLLRLRRHRRSLLRRALSAPLQPLAQGWSTPVDVAQEVEETGLRDERPGKSTLQAVPLHSYLQLFSSRDPVVAGENRLREAVVVAGAAVVDVVAVARIPLEDTSAQLAQKLWKECAQLLYSIFGKGGNVQPFHVSPEGCQL